MSINNYIEFKKKFSKNKDKKIKVDKFTKFIKDAISTNSDIKTTFRFVLLISAIVSIIAQIISFSDGLVFAYNDAGLHLDVARRIYDSRDPGIINQIGIVWLPVPHLIYIPFVYFDFLWVTGLAGCIVGFICFIISAGFLYKVIRIITGENISSLLGTAFFVFNPNILYLYTTAMTEPIFLMFIILAIYHVLNWERTGLSGELVRAGIVLGLASLTRYESWGYFLCLFFVVFLVTIFEKKKHPVKSLIYFSFVPILCIAWYLWLNYSLHGDVLTFQRGPYSSEFQVNLRYASIGGAPYKHDIDKSLDILNTTLISNTGFVMAALAFTGLILFLVKRKFSVYCLIPLAMLIFYIFNLISLYYGQVAIETPKTIPKGYFQTRYVVGIIPGLCVFVGFFFTIIKEINYKIVAFCIFIFIEFMSWYIVWPMGVPAIGEAKTAIMLSQPFRRTSNYLKTYYDGGNILYDDFSIIFFSGTGIPMKDRIHEYTWDVGNQAMNKPSTVVRWVLFNKTNPNDKIYIAMKNNLDFAENFKLMYNDEGIEVYKRKF